MTVSSIAWPVSNPPQGRLTALTGVVQYVKTTWLPVSIYYIRELVRYQTSIDN